MHNRIRKGIRRDFMAGQKQYWKPGNMLYPVPAVMVTCERPGEKPNIITIAWAGTVCSDPAMVSVSIRRERYSHAVIQETGEFVINLTTAALAKAADFCGVRSGRDIDWGSQRDVWLMYSGSSSCPNGAYIGMLRCTVLYSKSFNRKTHNYKKARGIICFGHHGNLRRND